MSDGGGALGEGIELTTDFGLASSFELDVEQAVAVTPPAMSPVEIRPGVALASLVFFRMCGGNVHHDIGVQPAYHELIFGVHVAPYLPWGLPRFGIYVVNIAVDRPAVASFLRAVHRMPVFDPPEPPRFRVQDDPARVEIADAQGPIATIENGHPAPAFAADSLTAHVFSFDEKRVWGYPETLSGPMFRHQSRGRAVTLAPHPFFRGLDLPRQPVPYLQVVGQPGRVARQVSHRAHALP